MTSDNKERYQQYHKFYLRDEKGQADRYRRQVRDYTKKFGDLLAEAPRGSALDVGCATGMLAAFLKEQGFEQVVGVDLNAELIEQAKQNVEAEFLVADAGEFLKGGRQFDVIFLTAFLPRPEHPLKHETGRLLAEGFVHRGVISQTCFLGAKSECKCVPDIEGGGRGI